MPWLTIAGVVGNLKHTELMNEMKWVETPILYRPLAQEPRRSVLVVGLGHAANPGSFSRRSPHSTSLPLVEWETVQSRISVTLAYPRFRAAVLSLFAISALLLSAVGLHGVLSQLVSQRTAELGVRRAVGAQTVHLLALVARQGGIPVLAGLTIGLFGTLGFSRLLTSLLYGTSPADPLDSGHGLGWIGPRFRFCDIVASASRSAHRSCGRFEGGLDADAPSQIGRHACEAYSAHSCDRCCFGEWLIRAVLRYASRIRGI